MRTYQDIEPIPPARAEVWLLERQMFRAWRSASGGWMAHCHPLSITVHGRDRDELQAEALAAMKRLRAELAAR